MPRIVTPRQALNALLRARAANEKGFGRYKAYVASPHSETGKRAEQRAHHWLDQEERQLGVIERFIRQYLAD